MKFRDWARCCVLLIGLTSGPGTEAAPSEEPPTLPQSANGVACNRASDSQLAEIQGFSSFIKTQLGKVSPSHAADASRIAESLQSALSSNCLDVIANGFADARDRPLGSDEAAYQVWKAANQMLSDIARYQSATDRVEAMDIAAAQAVVSRWQRPPSEAADFYFSALGVQLGAGYTKKDPKAFDRALTIARERILPLADKQATPEIWFRVHFLIGDMLSGKTNWLEPGETRIELAKQSIAATELALLGKPPNEQWLFMARMGLAVAYAIASSSAGFTDQTLNDGTVAAVGKILADPQLTPDLAAWGYLHDAYARATMSHALQMQNPERGRRFSDALAVADQGLARINRDRALAVWGKLQTDRAMASHLLAIDATDKAKALHNLDVAIASDEAILAMKEQLAASGSQDIVARAQSHHRDLLDSRTRVTSGSTVARPARSKR